MWWTAAAEPSADPSQPIVVALISALGGVVAAAFAALVSIARREDRNEPTATPSLGERTAVLERRALDNDERDDLQDHRIESVERFLDRRHPDWRP